MAVEFSRLQQNRSLTSVSEKEQRGELLKKLKVTHRPRLALKEKNPTTKVDMT